MRANLIISGLAAEFWPEAILYTAQSRFYSWITRTGHGAGRTPFEWWFDYIPDLSKLRSFGSPAYVILQPQERTQLDLNSAASAGIFLYYSDKAKSCYVVLDPRTKRIVPRGDVHIIDKVFTTNDYFKSLPSYSKLFNHGDPSTIEQFLMEESSDSSTIYENEESLGSSTSTSTSQTASPTRHDPAISLSTAADDQAPEPEEPSTETAPLPSSLKEGSPEPVAPPTLTDSASVRPNSDQVPSDGRKPAANFILRSLRQHQPGAEVTTRRSMRPHQPAQRAIEEGYSYLITTTNPQLEELALKPPLTFNQALKHPLNATFIEAHKEEYGGLCERGTFGFISNPEERKEIRAKHKPIRMGMTIRTTPTAQAGYMKVKARMFVLGNNQPEWQIGDTFAPTARSSTTRLFTALAVQNDLDSRNIDIKQAYLHAEAPEDIYVIIPKELSGDVEDQVAKLNLALYGLAESGKKWNDLANAHMKSIGYTQLVSDPAAYIKRYPDGHYNLVSLHVDDFGNFATTPIISEEFKNDLSSRLEIGTAEDMKKFVGMEVDRRPDGTTIKQSTYTLKACNEGDVRISKIVHNPSKGVEDSRDLDLVEKSISFAQLPREVMVIIGLIRYLADHTRPDILYATARAMSDPTGAAARRILQYVYHTRDLGLTYRKDPQGFELIAFVDASFNQDPDGTSWYGYAIFPNRYSGAIEACSKKIPLPVQSVAEAEHYAAGEVAKTVLHFRHLLEEISLPATKPIEVNSDSSSTIIMVGKNAYSSLRRHFHPRRHALRTWQQDKLIKFEHVPGDYNVADIFTKVLAVDRFIALRDVLLGITPLAEFYPKYQEEEKLKGSKPP
jgi:hypothetical protein